MRDTLADALLALIQMAPTVVDSAETEGPSPPETSDSEPTPAPETSAIETPDSQEGGITNTIESLVEEANNRFEAAEEAQRTGDWAAYGRELNALQDILQQLMDLTQ